MCYNKTPLSGSLQHLNKVSRALRRRQAEFVWLKDISMILFHYFHLLYCTKMFFVAAAGAETH